MTAGSLAHIERAAAGTARGALVFFHGLYGKPDDFLAFMDKLDPERQLHAFLPQGAHPMGEGRSSWIDRDAETPAGDLAGICAWLDALPFPAEQQIIGGWSQGASIAYSAALRPGRAAPAALLALGGWLWEDPAPSLVPPFPEVLIAHGRRDDAVPVERARAARDALRRHGLAVAYHETDVGHSIDPEVVPELRAFVARALPI